MILIMVAKLSSNFQNDLHRAMQKSQSALSQQLTILSATLLCLVFTRFVLISIKLSSQTWEETLINNFSYQIDFLFKGVTWMKTFLFLFYFHQIRQRLRHSTLPGRKLELFSHRYLFYATLFQLFTVAEAFVSIIKLIFETFKSFEFS